MVSFYVFYSIFLLLIRSKIQAVTPCLLSFIKQRVWYQTMLGCCVFDTSDLGVCSLFSSIVQNTAVLDQLGENIDGSVRVQNIFVQTWDPQ